MYEEFYNLKTDPFCLSPDPGFRYAHSSYRKAKAYMLFAFRREEGILLLTGDPGTGKTTLIKEQLIEWKTTDVNLATLVTTQLEADDLLRLTAFSFGLDVGGVDKATIIHSLNQYLISQQRRKRRNLLIVDEAQDLKQSALEELRLLSNFECSNRPLLQIFLVGQRQLLNTLGLNMLEQLRQRLTVAATLEPISVEELEAYIKHRLWIAGWKNDPLFDQALFPIIHDYSGGIPRRINQVCSRLLLHGYVSNRHELTVADINIVLQELIDENLSLSPASVNTHSNAIFH